MIDANEQLLDAARTHAMDLFRKTNRPGLVFHTWQQTEEVVNSCREMAGYYHLSDDDRLVLLLAALFHNTGYCMEGDETPIARSIAQARAFLQSHLASETVMQRVASCIKATAMPQMPVSLVEQILCDAALAYFSKDTFAEQTRLLRQEQEARIGRKIGGKEWRRANIDFFKTHQYFTGYGQEKLQPGKEENRWKLSKKKKRTEQIIAEQPAYLLYPQTGTPPVAKKAGKETEKGVQTMVRITSGNHMELSNLADKKANILITVNSIILSLLLHRLTVSTQYLWPVGILVLSCLVSDTFSILATRPSVSSGKFTEEDIRNKRTNLLFFGNFYQMSLSDYQWAMKQMMEDRDYLYSTIQMDTYYLGLVVAKKYRLLRIAYTVFMIGMLAAVLAFLLMAILGTNGHANPGSISTAFRH